MPVNGGIPKSVRKPLRVLSNNSNRNGGGKISKSANLKQKIPEKEKEKNESLDRLVLVQSDLSSALCQSWFALLSPAQSWFVLRSPAQSWFPNQLVLVRRSRFEFVDRREGGMEPEHNEQREEALFDDFFKRLDEELNKVSEFYRKKVEEVIVEADELSRQMKAEFRWWDEIDQHLLLGAVPFPKDVPRLKQLGVSGVITLNESFETLVPTSLYQAHGIDHLVIPTRDYLFVPSQSDIMRAVDFIHKLASSGRTTYVHCKAGRGRSTTIVLCYLVENKNMTPSGALDFVRFRRPRVLLAPSQWKVNLITLESAVVALLGDSHNSTAMKRKHCFFLTL